MHQRTHPPEKILNFSKRASACSEVDSSGKTKTYRTRRLAAQAAILSISRDTCSDSIAKLFGACFCGYRTIIARYVVKWGIAQMCLCETKCQGGVSHHFGELLSP